MKVPTSDSSFYTYLTQMDAVPEIKETLAILSVRHCFDVDLILYSIWYAASGFGKLKREELSRLIVRTHGWSQKLIAPLHRLRTLVQQLQFDMETCDMLMRCIMEAKRTESLFLVNRSLCFPQIHRKVKMRCGDALQNIFTYYKLNKIVLMPFDCAQLKIILAICFDIDQVSLDNMCHIHFERFARHHMYQLKLNFKE